ESRAKELTRLHGLRQQWRRKGQEVFYSLADFSAAADAKKAHGKSVHDYIAAFAVTAGLGADELARRFDADHDDYNSIMTKALADRLAEAFAACLHREAPRRWWRVWV